MKALLHHFRYCGMASCCCGLFTLFLLEVANCADTMSSKDGVPVMTLELSSTQSHIQVTQAYSNAVLDVVLPYYSAFAEKLRLEVSTPILKSAIADCRILPWHNSDNEIPNVSIKTKDGLWLSFEFGNVNGFSYPNAYGDLQNPNGINQYFGAVKISKEQAIQAARATIAKTGTLSSGYKMLNTNWLQESLG